MSRKYKRNRNGVDYKRLSIYLPKELAAKVKAESEGRLESQNMVINKIIAGFFKRSDEMAEGADSKGSEELRRLRDDVLAKSFTRED